MFAEGSRKALPRRRRRPGPRARRRVVAGLAGLLPEASLGLPGRVWRSAPSGPARLSETSSAGRRATVSRWSASPSGRVLAEGVEGAREGRSWRHSRQPLRGQIDVVWRASWEAGDGPGCASRETSGSGSLGSSSRRSRRPPEGSCDSLSRRPERRLGGSLGEPVAGLREGARTPPPRCAEGLPRRELRPLGAVVAEGIGVSGGSMEDGAWAR
jgi:hypothetical protein